MNANCKKTKEMILGLDFSKGSEYKLLGVTINASLKWDVHINATTSKVAK